MKRALALGVLLLAGGAAQAGEETPPPCTAPEYRQFDFWIGDWDVSTPDGKVVGHNRIDPILSGCALQENWTSTGSSGHSFNIYDDRNGQWHQTWVDSNGLLLQLDGGLADGAMVLAGKLKTRDGAVQDHRITWTSNADGTVRQHWQNSTDGGATWETLFDGLYRKSSQ